MGELATVLHMTALINGIMCFILFQLRMYVAIPTSSLNKNDSYNRYLK